MAKPLTERLLHNVCPCFDSVFAQLGVISRARKKFVKRAAVAERYLIITKESVSNIVSLGKMAGKAEPIS